MSTRPPFETFKNPTCKGCFALGSACGTCEKCVWEKSQGVNYQELEPRIVAGLLESATIEELEEMLHKKRLGESLPRCNEMDAILIEQGKLKTEISLLRAKFVALQWDQDKCPNRHNHDRVMCHYCKN